MDNSSELSDKTQMTNEERLKLCRKLDADLEEFITNLPKRKYQDGWPEDRWEEEMAKHPFFMKKVPELGEELHPLYEGLQKLKYDPEENEPYDLAIAYKDDGNFNFKHKNYRLAIVAYSEGIKQNCGDHEVEASLLNNRAAAHWFLKNYRSCLKDCELALKIKPMYNKVLNRAANCCYHLTQYNKALEFCDKLLEDNSNNKEILDLRKKCLKELKEKERNERKKDIEKKKQKKLEDDLIKEIVARGYQIEQGCSGNINLSQLEPYFPELAQYKVSLNKESNSLVWPVVFVYPEYKIMDYVQQFNEHDSISEHLNIIFETYPEWDQQKKYAPGNINVYFENLEQKLVKVDDKKPLGEVLMNPGYVIKRGTPSFMIFVKGSDAEKMYLEIK
ncbi:DNA polymerase interacting tetratricopeptide repeat-containing, protein of 47 kDa [Euwallacea fornicatus]|uniref:DNA polymerase interacting tetratricopeptide repeat-containing, protein of 47 kDa n=1 Tax=Euwallacea fornicatus TaxID=995702 RepID=UPI00338F875D